MASRRKVDRDPSGHHANASMPSQEDEADILAEVGGERDEGGELLVDEETVLAVGAVDAASVRENRRMEAAVNKKRGGAKHVTFNTDDLLTKYEELIKTWGGASTLDVSARRLTGPEVTHSITSRPRSGAELYAALKEAHGQYEEAKYEVKFWDVNQKQYRGTGRITMPDTRPAAAQGQPMTYPPNGAPPPGYPGYQPGYAPSQPAFGYPSPPAQAAPPQYPATPPAVQIMPPSFDPNSMMTMMNEMFSMFQRMQPPPQPPPPQVQFPHFQVPPAMPPMPPPQASMAEQMAWMKQMFDTFQQLQQGVQAPARAAPPQPVAPAPAPAPAPSPASSMAEMMGMMTMMLEFVQKMQPPAPRQLGPGSPFRGGQRPYYPQGEDPRAEAARGPYTPQQAPQRPPTMMEQFRESMGTLRAASGMIQEMESLLPGREQQEAVVQDDDDDSPIRVIETGPVKMVINKSDGSTRLWETGLANADKVFKWVGEQHEVIQRAHAARHPQQQPQQQQRQQLPSGYVEVRPGDQPPPGYSFSPPIDTSGQEVAQSPLPPPPDHVPPPIQTTPQVPQQRPAWGPPTIDDQGEEQ